MNTNACTQSAGTPGWRKDYRIVIAAPGGSQARLLPGGSPGLAGQGGVPARTAARAAVAMTAALLGRRRALAFLPRVARACQLAGTLAAALPAPGQRPGGPVTARHARGGMSRVRRAPGIPASVISEAGTARVPGPRRDHHLAVSPAAHPRPPRAVTDRRLCRDPGRC
jgi:hypothetical protein